MNKIFKIALAALLLPAMAVMYVWREAGYLMVFFLSGLQSINADVLEAACPVRPVTTHASRTARGFFEKRGYRLLRAQRVERRGQLLENFVMEKP